MRTLTLCLTVLFPLAGAAFADLLIHTTDGRTLRVNVSRSQVRSIEFEDDKPAAPPAKPNTPDPSSAGVWNITFRDQHGRAGHNTLTLRQSGSTVTGTLTTTDGTGTAVKGRIDGDQVTLSRDTGVQTIQHYKFTIRGNRFTGTYWNEGRHPDRGTIEGTRR